MTVFSLRKHYQEFIKICEKNINNNQKHDTLKSRKKKYILLKHAGRPQMIHNNSQCIHIQIFILIPPQGVKPNTNNQCCDEIKQWHHNNKFN